MGIYLHRNEKYQHFWYVCKGIFVSSYGQSSVERGFSINKDLLVENLNQQSLIGQRKVYYYFSSLGIGIHEYEILLDLTKSCKSAYSRYAAALEEKKKERASTEKNLKRKLKMDELADMKLQRHSSYTTDALNKDVEKYSFEAEDKEDLSILSEANAIRKTVMEKQKSIKSLNSTIAKLEKECKVA